MSSNPVTVRCLAFVLLGILALLPSHAARRGMTTRYSISPETVRIVLDLPAAVAFTVHPSPHAVTVTLEMPLAAAPPATTLDDPIVTGFMLAQDIDNRAVLTVPLAQPRQAHVFAIPPKKGASFRLVIDILKRFTRETVRQLTPVLRYVRLEKQSDDRYFVAHLVIAKARDPHVRLQVVRAAGERETVAAMTRRAGAACGINGGYFLDRTRPVGLLKVDDVLHSLPVWGRPAIAIPRQGPPVFGAPRGRWELRLPDGSSREAPDWLDTMETLPIPPIRVMAGANFTRAVPPAGGRMVVVRGSKVAALPTAATPLDPGDFALFLTGDGETALGDALPEGATVNIVPRLDSRWDRYAGAVGAGPRLLADGKLWPIEAAQRFKPDITTGRASRSGIGATRDGRVILAVVESPGPYGGGATLEEMARLLKDRGARDAMNLDGGGSSTLAIGADTVNLPPGSWVRPVASGIVIIDELSAGKPDKPKT